eukprot:SAG22_NODE_8_length_37215_cov_120.960351_9_plen_142_part_00
MNYIYKTRSFSRTGPAALIPKSLYIYFKAEIYFKTAKMQIVAFLRGSTLHAPASVDSRVFAPHKRGLQYIVVQGFIIEKAANQWIANFWFPQNYHYAQSGALGTRTGYRWTVRNNTIRYAKTIGFDCQGHRGGLRGPPGRQ